MHTICRIRLFHKEKKVYALCNVEYGSLTFLLSRVNDTHKQRFQYYYIRALTYACAIILPLQVQFD